MATVRDFADSITKAADRLAELFKGNSWGLASGINQTLGGYAPPFSVNFVVLYAESIAARVRRLTRDELDQDDLSDLLKLALPFFDNVQFGNIQNDPDAVVGSFMSMLHAVDSRIPDQPAPTPPPPQVDWESIKDEKDLLPKDLARRLRSVAARLDDIEPKAEQLDQIIAAIMAAHSTAEELPTDIEDLKEKRSAIGKIVSEAESHLRSAQSADDNAQAAVTNIAAVTEQARAAMLASERALSGSTGVGLAVAFERRKHSLSFAGIWWTFGLLLALTAGVAIGWDRVTALREVLSGNRSASVIWANVVLAILGVGGPIWFAWLSTKQIGNAFRLAEDYAFKAAMSRAYEGYRKEAVDLDPKLRSRLFDTALQRLEEAPIRLLDAKHHASPLQELLDNPSLRRSLEKIPGIADQIIALIPSKGGAAAIVAPVGAAAAAASAIAAEDAADKKEERG